MEPDIVAKAGYKGIRKQIIEIATAQKTGLTAREQVIVKMLLNGKTRKNAAQDLNKSKETISYVLWNACKKIRWQIKAQKIKARKT